MKIFKPIHVINITRIGTMFEDSSDTVNGKIITSFNTFVGLLEFANFIFFLNL